MPDGKIQRRSQIINYHHTREGQFKVIIKFVHINGNDNIAKIVNNSRAYNMWFPIMKPLQLWSDMYFLNKIFVSEGIETRLSTPPIYQAKVTNRQSFKLDL